jgi:hypothetical protein
MAKIDVNNLRATKTRCCAVAVAATFAFTAAVAASTAHALPGDGAADASGDERTYTIYCEGQSPQRPHWPACYAAPDVPAP